MIVPHSATLDNVKPHPYHHSTMTQDTTLMTVEEVAEYLNLTKKAVRRRVERDAIPYRKVGRSIRFHPQELEEWTKTDAGDTDARYGS